MIISILEDESIEVETKEESEETSAETVKSIDKILKSLASYINNPDNKDKINREMKLYPCKKCIHHNNDDSWDICGVFKCLLEPEKYWKAQED